MKICVISDSHGYTSNVEKIVMDKSYDKIFFLGDGIRDFDDIYDDRIVMVEGNCDIFSQSPLLTWQYINDKRIMLCHGHQYSVKSGIWGLLREATQGRADIVCYGHTHIQSIEKYEGIYFVNPGSLASGRAIEIIIDDKITFNKIFV